MKKQRSAHSFTLIELLVVVAVIMLLMAVILPVMGNTRRAARNVKCKNNLKQLHVAFTSYVKEKSSDSGGLVIPDPTSWATNGEWVDGVFVNYPDGYHLQRHGWITWTDYMIDGETVESGPPPSTPLVWWGTNGIAAVTRSPFFEYTGRSLDMYICPEFALSSVSGGSDPTGTKFDDVDNPRVRSYVMNASIAGFGWNDFEQASQTLLFGESHLNKSVKVGGVTVCVYGFLENGTPGTDGVLDSTPSGSITKEAIGSLHQGNKSNGVFVDGHVQELTWDQTTNACWGAM